MHIYLHSLLYQYTALSAGLQDFFKPSAFSTFNSSRLRSGYSGRFLAPVPFRNSRRGYGWRFLAPIPFCGSRRGYGWRFPVSIPFRGSRHGYGWRFSVSIPFRGSRRGYGWDFLVPIPCHVFRLLLKNREREQFHSHSLFCMIS